MITYISRLFHKKEKTMAKTLAPIGPTIKFSRSDSPKPKRLAGGFVGLRTPFPITLKPLATMNVDFGMSCDTPLLLIGTRLEINGSPVVGANNNIKVQIKNPSLAEDAIFDVGDAIILAHPLIPNEFIVE